MEFPGEEVVRKVVQLVVPSLRNITRADGVPGLLRVTLRLMDAPIPDQVFIRTLCSSVGYTPMDTT